MLYKQRKSIVLTDSIVADLGMDHGLVDSSIIDRYGEEECEPEEQ